MQFLQAGDRQILLLELDPDVVARVASQCGLSCKITDGLRALVVEVAAEGREGPLLLFDAADPANLGWFSRCQFYVDGQSGDVLQTPFRVGNALDRSGKPLTSALRVQIAKEIPPGFRLPGRQPVNEQAVYGILASFLTALTDTGVAVCGGMVVKPLTGRMEPKTGRA